MMDFMSHGTQDLYPTMLQMQRHFDPRDTVIINVISVVGAIVGGILSGLLSDRFGRRRAMIAAALMGLLLVPLWGFSSGMAIIALGAFLMQFTVQGAWGMIPVHLNELSPGPLRVFSPGFGYQLGVLFASGASTFEALMTDNLTYAEAMGLVAALAFAIGVVVIAARTEAQRIPFGARAEQETSEASAKRVNSSFSLPPVP